MSVAKRTHTAMSTRAMHHGYASRATNSSELFPLAFRSMTSYCRGFDADYTCTIQASQIRGTTLFVIQTCSGAGSVPL